LFQVQLLFQALQVLLMQVLHQAWGQQVPLEHWALILVQYQEVQVPVPYLLSGSQQQAMSNNLHQKVQVQWLQARMIQ
jgi:hypothetical protein